MSEGGKDKEAFQPKLSHLGLTPQGWGTLFRTFGEVLISEGQVRHSQPCAQGQWEYQWPEGKGSDSNLRLSVTLGGKSLQPVGLCVDWGRGGAVEVWRLERTEPGHPCCCMGTHVWLLGAERLGARVFKGWGGGGGWGVRRLSSQESSRESERRCELGWGQFCRPGGHTLA